MQKQTSDSPERGKNPKFAFNGAAMWLGFISLAVAQYIFEKYPPISHSVNAEIWNAVYKLEIPNFDNAHLALPFLLAGFLLWLVFGKPHWHETETKFEFTSPQFKRSFISISVILAAYAYLIVRLSRHQHTHALFFLWILLLIWATILIFQWDRANGTELTLPFNASDLMLILLLLFIGFSAGTFALTDIPKKIVPDEDPFWLVGSAIANQYIELSPFDIGVFTFPALTNILQGLVMRMVGATIWGWRFSSVLPAVLTVIPLYLLARDWFNRPTAFAAGLMMLVNPYFITFSRLGYNNSQSLFPVTLSIYFWERGIHKKSLLHLWFGGLAAGLCFYSFFGAWIGPTTIGLSILVLFIRRQVTFKRTLVMLSVLVIPFLMLALPRIAYIASGPAVTGLYHKLFETTITAPFYGETYYTREELQEVREYIRINQYNAIVYHPRIYGELLTRGAIRTILALYDPFIVTEHFAVSGLAGVITPIFFSIGMALALKRWRNHRISLLLIWLLGGLLFLSIIAAFPPRHTHLVSVIPVIALLSGLGLSSTLEQFKMPAWYRNSGLGILLLIISFFSLRTYFTQVPLRHFASFEDHTLWLAREIRLPQETIIVYAKEGDDSFRDNKFSQTRFLPNLLLKTLPQNAPYVSQEFKDIPILLFYEGTDRQVVDSILNSGLIFYTEYKGPQQSTQGYIFSNLDIPLSIETDWPAERRKFTASPIMGMLGTLLLGMLISAAVAVKAGAGTAGAGVDGSGQNGQAV